MGRGPGVLAATPRTPPDASPPRDGHTRSALLHPYDACTARRDRARPALAARGRWPATWPDAPRRRAAPSRECSPALGGAGPAPDLSAAVRAPPSDSALIGRRLWRSPMRANSPLA